MNSLFMGFIIRLRASCEIAIVFWGVFSTSPSVFGCTLTSLSSVLNEISKNHPVISTTNQRKKVLGSEVDLASQVPNPILNFTSNHGSSQGVGGSETTGNLLYVFEMGGKQSSRIGLAQANEKLGQVRIQNQTDQILIESSLMVNRLGQVESLLKLYNESLQVFEKMGRTLSRNKQLSPEQRIQLDIVDMEVSKHRLRISDLENEFNQISTHLVFYVGQSCTIDIEAKEQEMPTPSSLNINQAQSPELRELEWQSKALTKSVSEEDAKAYPDLKIGPSFQIEDQGVQSVNRFGLSLKVDLPFLNRNQGGRALAKNRQKLSQTQLSFKQKENNVYLQSLMASYKTIYDTLKKVPKKQELLEKHHRIEQLFLRGLISIPTMIDGHDQLLTLMEQRDAQESQGLDSFLKISQAQGNLNKVLKLEGAL